MMLAQFGNFYFTRGPVNDSQRLSKNEIMCQGKKEINWKIKKIVYERKKKK